MKKRFKQLILKIRHVKTAVKDGLGEMLVRCSYCRWRHAVWSYMPGELNACDKCVPRGCSCNVEPTPEAIAKFGEDAFYTDSNTEAAKDSANYYEPVDEKGRKHPCCEWMYVKKTSKRARGKK